MNPDPGSVAPALPRVTPYLLRQADTMCARRLACVFDNAQGSRDAVNRARLRDSFLDAARTAHATDGRPRPAPWQPLPNLEPEERAVFDHAVHWYLHHFGDRAVRLEPHDCDTPTESAARGVRIGGWVDLSVVDEQGTRELRQLDLWGGRAPADPLDLEAVLVAVLRLNRWAGSGELQVSWSDLVGGAHVERRVDLATELPGLREQFDDRLDAVRRRAAKPTAEPGRDCGACRYVRGCPAHPGAMHVGAPRGDFRPGVITLTPTAIEQWTRCPREWRDALLNIPASDGTTSGDHGLRLHAVLRWLHEQGDCHDDELRSETVAAHGGDDRLYGELRQHADRCPSDAQSAGHERDFARYRSRPYPPFMATARLDAVWIHHGMVDARDYKSGGVSTERVADDPRAWVQAWVLAPFAAKQDLRLRVRYEHLAAEVVEDPEIWEPDGDELEEIERKLADVVAAMHTDAAHQGVADPGVCVRCRYRSICPQSATPSEPIWPRVDETGDLDEDLEDEA